MSDSAAHVRVIEETPAYWRVLFDYPPFNIVDATIFEGLQNLLARMDASPSLRVATARQFVNEGASVFITGRRQSQLAEAVKEIGPNATSVQADVSNLDELDRLFAQIKQGIGKLDIVFANAGVAKYSRLGEITEDLYDEIFNINVKGMLFTVQKALPLMPGGASVILTSSIVGSKGLTANSVYAATKAVARSFARTWTTDLKHRRISRERD